MGAEHRADLRDEHRVAPEDLSARLDHLAGRLGVADVLDDPCVGAVAVALAGEVDKAGEGPTPGPNPLDRGHLLLELRIGLIFSVEPIRARAAPIRPPRRRYSSVSGENQIFSPPRASAAGDHVLGAAAVGGDARPGELNQPGPPAPFGCRRSCSAPRPCRRRSRFAGLVGGLKGPRDSAGEMDRDDLHAVGEQGLVDGDEVADRGLRGADASGLARRRS